MCGGIFTRTILSAIKMSYLESSRHPKGTEQLNFCLYLLIVQILIGSTSLTFEVYKTYNRRKKVVYVVQVLTILAE